MNAIRYLLAYPIEQKNAMVHLHPCTHGAPITGPGVTVSCMGIGPGPYPSK